MAKSKRVAAEQERRINHEQAARIRTAYVDAFSNVIAVHVERQANYRAQFAVQRFCNSLAPLIEQAERGDVSDALEKMRCLMAACGFGDVAELSSVDLVA